MFLRITMVFFTLILAIVAVLLAARHPTGTNAVSYEEPAGLLIVIGMVIILFVLPLILLLLHHRVAGIIFTVYKVFVAITFFGLIPIGFLFPQHIPVSIIAVIGFLVNIASILLVLITNENKETKA